MNRLSAIVLACAVVLVCGCSDDTGDPAPQDTTTGTDAADSADPGDTSAPDGEQDAPADVPPDAADTAQPDSDPTDIADTSPADTADTIAADTADASDTSPPDATDALEDGADMVVAPGDLLDPAWLDAGVLVSSAVVPCTLENGAASTCHQLVFSGAVPFAQGPFCPPTIDDVGGFGVYDGDTNPGFQVMKAALWNAMEADGYDIVDPSGNIRILDPAGGIMPQMGSSYCLDATFDDTLTLTFLVPVVPVLLGSPNVIETVEKFGVSLDGVPLTGPVPSATAGPPGMMPPGGSTTAMIPALDRCGGHPDPAGYFHWHFVPESINETLSAVGIADVSCANIPQDATALVGFAFDGHPVYAAAESDGSLPSDLDGCNGHTAATPEHPQGVYHYHALRDVAPNMPPCLVGAVAQQNFRIQ